MVPLMMRAMRIAVIGDKQQLSHICLLSKQTDFLLRPARGGRKTKPNRNVKQIATNNERDTVSAL